MRLGIDASNLRAGGGLVHLKHFIKNLEPKKYGISSVVVWCSDGTAQYLPEANWLVVKKPTFLNGPLLFRSIWQKYVFPHHARRFCDFLFIPGGVCYVKNLPFVAMSRNVLPFMPNEIKRYKIFKEKLRLLLLRRSLVRSYNAAMGLVFLTKYAKRLIYPLLDTKAETAIIPHGVTPAFDFDVKPQVSLTQYSLQNPIKLLYVSTLDVYKNQDVVIDAVALLRQKGLPVELDLIGNSRFPSLTRQLRERVSHLCQSNGFIRVYGRLAHEELAPFYRKADIFIFASSAENMPNILVEAMFSGLPIVCSNLSVMPEVLYDAGFYFDPRSREGLVSALTNAIYSPTIRQDKAEKAKKLAGQYCWRRCVDDTMRFLIKLYNQSHQRERKM